MRRSSAPHCALHRVNSIASERANVCVLYSLPGALLPLPLLLLLLLLLAV
jgi:hypothetical protein